MKRQAVALVAKEFERQEDELEARRIETEFFKSWQFWRVTDDAFPPRVLVVATSSTKTVKPSFAGGFSEIIASEPVHLAAPEAAIRYVTFFISVTDLPAFVLKSVDEIPGINESERREWAGRVTQPIARAKGRNYLVELWVWRHEQLTNDRFAVTSQGLITSEVEVAVPKIGVEIGIE